MEIIKDLKVLNKFAKKYNMQFDKQYKYCINEGNFKGENKCKLKYFDGCFYPYLIRESKQDNEEAQIWLDSKKYVYSDRVISDEETDYKEGAMINDIW